MVASEAGGKCKKHPEQEQLPGVCPACLRERLSELYGFRSQIKAGNMMDLSSCSSQSSSPPYSSASSSTRVSPGRGNHHRRASEVTEKMATAIGVVHGDGLKKSRSIAVVPIGRGGDGKKKTKRGGFWSKLLRSRGDKSKGAHTHSKGRLA